jgi:hypothetical protein
MMLDVITRLIVVCSPGRSAGPVAKGSEFCEDAAQGKAECRRLRDVVDLWHARARRTHLIKESVPLKASSAVRSLSKNTRSGASRSRFYPVVGLVKRAAKLQA